MITANDIADQLNRLLEFEDKHVDQWLTDVFIPKAFHERMSDLSFPEEKISNYWIKYGKIYNRDFFIKALKRRNLAVAFKYDDRPCGGCYFNISCKT